MPSAFPPSDASERDLAQAILARMATDLSLILDRDLVVEDVRCERRSTRPAGSERVHISFKLGIDDAQGCLLAPLPDAIALAGFMMMLPDEDVARERTRTQLDGPYKEALLEVGKLLAAACDSVLRQTRPSTTRSDGCQGVRPDVRPALRYSEGDPLLVAHCRARVHEFAPFELILVLPGLGCSSPVETLSDRS